MNDPGHHALIAVRRYLTHVPGFRRAFAAAYRDCRSSAAQTGEPPGPAFLDAAHTLCLEEQKRRIFAARDAVLEEIESGWQATHADALAALAECWHARTDEQNSWSDINGVMEHAIELCGNTVERRTANAYRGSLSDQQVELNRNAELALNALTGEAPGPAARIVVPHAFQHVDVNADARPPEPEPGLPSAPPPAPPAVSVAAPAAPLAALPEPAAPRRPPRPLLKAEARLITAADARELGFETALDQVLVTVENVDAGPTERATLRYELGLFESRSRDLGRIDAGHTPTRIYLPVASGSNETDGGLPIAIEIEYGGNGWSGRCVLRLVRGSQPPAWQHDQHAEQLPVHIDDMHGT